MVVAIVEKVVVVVVEVVALEVVVVSLLEDWVVAKGQNSTTSYVCFQKLQYTYVLEMVVVVGSNTTCLSFL